VALGESPAWQPLLPETAGTRAETAGRAMVPCSVCVSQCTSQPNDTLLHPLTPPTHFHTSPPHTHTLPRDVNSNKGRPTSLVLSEALKRQALASSIMPPCLSCAQLCVSNGAPSLPPSLPLPSLPFPSPDPSLAFPFPSLPPHRLHHGHSKLGTVLNGGAPFARGACKRRPRGPGEASATWPAEQGREQSVYPPFFQIVAHSAQGRRLNP